MCMCAVVVNHLPHLTLISAVEHEQSVCGTVDCLIPLCICLLSLGIIKGMIKTLSRWHLLSRCVTVSELFEFKTVREFESLFCFYLLLSESRLFDPA